MANKEQEAFREPADPSLNPPDRGTNSASGPLPLFALMAILIVVVAIVAVVMISGAMQ